MEPTQEQAQPIHDFKAQNSIKFSLTNKIIVIFICAAVLGILSGFGFSRNTISSVSTGTVSNLSTVGKGTLVGSGDTNTFKDTAEGILKTGGIDGEGAFHLVRPGGDSQNVYLTSSIVDLSALVDRKIKVWGQTQKAKHAGWLMDVGRIEVLE